MLKYIALLLSVFVIQAASATETPLNNSQKAKDIYETLYTVDYRPLSVDDFLKYNKALVDLRDLAMALEKVNSCESSTKNLVKKYQYEFTTYDGCRNTQNRDVEVLSGSEATAIRECYSEGYAKCDVLLAARIIAKTTSKDYMKCAYEVDVVIQGHSSF